ncbi:MAG: hypothetical protein EOS47_32540, partial [Mesorhizobium sp.]
YSDGERGAVTNDFANRQRCREGAGAAASHLLPVTIRGEGAGRRMRGGAALCNHKGSSRTPRRAIEGIGGVEALRIFVWGAA